MKILILYATQYGDTRYCAEKMANELKDEVTCIDVKQGVPELNNYDCLVIGSSVKYGRLLKPLRQYVSLHIDEIVKIPHALFFLCGKTEEMDYYQGTLFPKSIQNTAFLNMYFGGTLVSKSKRFLDKLFIRRYRSSILEKGLHDGEYTPLFPSILDENVLRMAMEIQNKFYK